MIQISQRVNNLSASATLVMLQKTNELRAAGVDVIGMSAGEPDFDTWRATRRCGARYAAS